MVKYYVVVLAIFMAEIVGSIGDFYSGNQAKKLMLKVLKEKDFTFFEKIEVNTKGIKTEPLNVYRFKSIEKDEILYGVFTQAQGRYEPFDYLMIVNNKFVVEKIKIIKYRSEHGGEIASKKWLSQFENYSKYDLQNSVKISALSGATISANSMLTDVPKVLDILIQSCQ